MNLTMYRDFYKVAGSFTWVKRSGVKMIRVILIGAGAGGRGGLLVAAGGTQQGLNGGTGGGYGDFDIPPALVGATETVIVGAGGAGVPAGTSAANGGGNSKFGSWVFAFGGQGGVFSLHMGSKYGVVTNITTPGATGGIGANSAAGQNTGLGGAAGGAAGAINAGVATGGFKGGDIGDNQAASSFLNGYGGLLAGGAGGVLGSGSNGAPGGSFGANAMFGGAGGGGGSSWITVGGTGGTGGNGGWPGGGGGSGGHGIIGGAAAGASGAGADGLVIVIQYF